MKTLLTLVGLLMLIPIATFSQAQTNHNRTTGEFDVDYENGWIAHVTWQLVVNQVTKTYNNGVTEIRYTSNYRDKWVYTNTETGETAQSPGVGNATGVYSFGPDGWEDDIHIVTHYVNDPLFGSYHINYNILLKFNPDTGLMEILDVQNEWFRE